MDDDTGSGRGAGDSDPADGGDRDSGAGPGGPAPGPDEGPGDRPGEAGDDGEEWRFDLNDLEDDTGRPPIEPGRPDPESVAFVLLGAVATVLVFLRLWLLLG